MKQTINHFINAFFVLPSASLALSVNPLQGQLFQSNIVRADWRKNRSDRTFTLCDPLESEHFNFSAVNAHSAKGCSIGFSSKSFIWMITYLANTYKHKTRFQDKEDHYLPIGKSLSAGWLLSRISSLTSNSYSKASSFFHYSAIGIWHPGSILLLGTHDLRPNFSPEH